MTTSPIVNTQPLQLRYRQVWATLGAVILAVLLTISLLPMDELVGPQPLSDKLMHALAFGFLMLWFCGLLARNRYWQAFAWLLAYGIMMEVLQLLTGYRYMELADVIADIIGLLAGWGLALLGLGTWPLWVERALGLQ